MDSNVWNDAEPAASLIKVVVAIATVLVFTLGPLMWTISCILRPVDRAARERNLPFRFSMGDFLCLFWVVQLPLAYVFQMRGDGRRDSQNEVDQFYWILTAAVWAIAPLAWVTVARALSKAGVAAGVHRMIFLGIVLPTVYYGLFPFMGMSIAVIFGVLESGSDYLAAHRVLVTMWWLLGVSLLACGFYSPWMVRRAGENAYGDVDEDVVLEHVKQG